MRKVLSGLVLLLAGVPAAAAPESFQDTRSLSLEDYLPATTAGFDRALPRPEDLLGYPLGAGYPHYEQVLAWFERLAEASPRVRLVELGRTFENRRQVTAVITSAGNQLDLEQVLERHLDGTPGVPIVTWHGYTVHGNEASGVQAAMAVAWYLAANEDSAVRDLLRRQVILIDPLQNPDGYARFSAWVTQAAGRVAVDDPAGREMAEDWPGARGNHYYFDLARDWLPLQQPESVNRESFLEQYRPEVMTDHHDLGGDTLWLLQPDLQSKGNRLISQENIEISKSFEEIYSRARERARRSYDTADTFTDFVSGKGAVWADLQGAIGLVFEQDTTVEAAAAGRAALPAAIHNQVVATLAAIDGAETLAEELRSYRRAHTRGELNPRDLPAAWIFDDGGDPARGGALMELVTRQGLDVFGVGGTVRIGGHTYEPDHAWVVPLLGPRAPLAQALFDASTDPGNPRATARSLQYAFGVQADRLTRTPTGLEPEAVVERDYVLRGPVYAEAWVLPWDDYFAPAVLYRLERAGVRPHVALEAFVGVSGGRNVRFRPGAIIVREADVPRGDERPVDLVSRLAAGKSPLIGLDPGSPGADRAHPLGPRTLPLDMPRVALLAGRGVNPAAAGAVWHALDFRLGIPVTQVRPGDLDEAVLARHTHLIVTDGDYDRIPRALDATLSRWVENGGVLVLTEGAAAWAQSRGWLPRAALPEPATADGSTPAAGGATTVAGAGESIDAVLAVELSSSHPLAFGIATDRVGLVRTSPVLLAAPAGRDFTVVGRYGRNPLLNGYRSEEIVAALAETPALLAVPRGRGAIIAFADDPAYRGVWWVGQRLLSNAVVFGSIIRAPIEPKPVENAEPAEGATGGNAQDGASEETPEPTEDGWFPS